MAFEINVPNEAYNFDQTIALNNTTYQLSMRYIKRVEGWEFSLATSSGTPIISNCRIQPEILLLNRHNFDEVAGDFICFKARDVEEPLGANNLGFGKAYRFYYLTRQELNG